MKTSKKLISIIVAVALLISTIAAVTTLTSSAATTKVSVWNGTTSVIQGGGSVVSNTKNPDGSVTIVTGDTLSQQYQYQISPSAFDKDKIAAAGNKVKLDFTVNAAQKSTGDNDSGYVKSANFTNAFGNDSNWSGIGQTKTIEVTFDEADFTKGYLAIVYQNYSGSGLKNVSVTIMFYVEEEASAETTTAGGAAETTTASEAVETTTATPIAETTTVDPSTLVKKAFYNFKPTNTGDTFKTEGWIASESYWGPTADLSVACQKDGSVYYSTAEAKANFYSQINSDWKGVPAIGDNVVYLDFTNNLSVAIKVKLQYADDNTTTIAAGETKTLTVKKVGDNGVLNIMIQNTGANIPVKEKSFHVSALYTLVPGDPNETTTAGVEETEPETEPQTTTKKVDPSIYTAGSVFSRYAEHHYSKSEGWISGASNLGDLSSYINVDPKGAFSLKIDASVGMKSQQVYAWYSVNGTENSRAVKAINEAKAGTGKLMFDITVNEAKDKNGKDATVGFKYTTIAGKSLNDATVVALPTGKTTRIVVDVTDYDPANLKGNTDYHYQLFFKNNNDWNGALSVLDLTMTPITVAVDPNAVVETTTVAPTTTEAVETTTEEVVATTTEAVETTTEEVVVTKTNPASDPEFKLFNPETDMDKFAVGLDGATGKVGDVVEISGHIANNPGLLCGTFVIKYDSDVLSPIVKDMGSDKVIDATVGEVFPTVQTGPAADVLDEEGNKTGYQTSTFILENNDVADVTKDGVLFTFKFEIIAKPAYGNTTNIVFANYDETMFANTSDEALEPVYQEGFVVVEEDEPETTTEVETPTDVETPDATTTEEQTTVVTKPELVSEAAFAAYDESKFNIVVDAVEGKAGNTVDVNITLNNNPGLWSGTFFLAYDPAVINPVETPVDGADYSVVKFSNMNIAGVDVTDGFVIDYTVDDYTFKMLPVSFGNAAMSDFTANGNLATVTFEIADGAKADDFSNIVFVNYDETLFNNVNGDEVEFTIKEGKVTVLGEPTEPETTKAPDATTKAPAGANATTANANVETPDATTASNGSNGSASDDVNSGAAAAPIAALAIAAGAAFVAFKARKK